MSGASNTLAAAQAKAYAKGLDVVVPKPNELFVDIDSKDDLAVFVTHIGVMAAAIPATWTIKPSPSGKEHRYHATVVLSRDVTVAERIALQAALGSDRLHECLSIISALGGNDTPTLFFEKKPAQLAAPAPVPVLPEYEA
jgi:hypothetical protein